MLHWEDDCLGGLRQAKWRCSVAIANIPAFTVAMENHRSVQVPSDVFPEQTCLHTSSFWQASCSWLIDCIERFKFLFLVGTLPCSCWLLSLVLFLQNNLPLLGFVKQQILGTIHRETLLQKTHRGYAQGCQPPGAEQKIQTTVKTKTHTSYKFINIFINNPL